MEIYLRHKEHGVTAVFDTGARDEMVKAGWEEFDALGELAARNAKQGKSAPKAAPAPVESTEDNSWLEPKIPGHPHKGKGR